MTSNVNEWLVWHYRYRQLCFGFLKNISWTTWRERHTNPSSGSKYTKLSIQNSAACSVQSKTCQQSWTYDRKQLISELRSQHLQGRSPFKRPVAQKYIYGLLGCPAECERKNKGHSGKPVMHAWNKNFKTNNQRNAVAEKCQSPSNEGQSAQVSLNKCPPTSTHVKITKKRIKN